MATAERGGSRLLLRRGKRAEVRRLVSSAECGRALGG